MNTKNIAILSGTSLLFILGYIVIGHPKSLPSGLYNDIQRIRWNLGLDMPKNLNETEQKNWNIGRDWRAIPQVGGSCKSMQDFFNKHFGRSDTTFSNFEGQVQQGGGDEVFCDGGAVIEDYPTGKKTCTDAFIFYSNSNTNFRWIVMNSSSCFVSN